MLIRWNKGTLSDGTDSLAVPIMPESQWPDLRAIVLITRLEFILIVVRYLMLTVYLTIVARYIY